MQYLAKPNQTLIGHILDCLKVLKYYLELNQKCIDNFCKRYALNRDNLLNSLLVALYFHDIGKVISNFQRRMQNTEDDEQRQSHAIVSFAILLELFKNAPNDEMDIRLFGYLAVLAHHGQLHNNSFQGRYVPHSVVLDSEYVYQFTESLRHWHSKLGFGQLFPFKQIVFDSVQKEISLKRVQDYIYSVLISRKFRQEGNPSHKIKYSFIYSILTLCDNLASHLVDDQEGQNDSIITEELLKHQVYHKYLFEPKCIFECNPIVDKPFDVQSWLQKTQSNYVILNVGCGEGKTAAALLFARNKILEGKANSIIFTLPTQFTCNSMFDDFIDPDGYRFKRSEVGIFHSNIYSFLEREARKELAEGDTISSSELRQMVTDAKRFNSFYHKPITISTVDHLLLSFIHGFRTADRAFGNILNSVVVFDELHYYEKHTLAIIFTCLKLLKQFKVPHIVMTGTLPESVKKQLLTINPEFETVVGESQKQPYRIIKMSEPMVKKNSNGEYSISLHSSLIKNIRDNLDKKQIVFVNQVERAKAVYKQLKIQFPVANIMCYHAKFTLNNRITKEKEIKTAFCYSEPVLLVVTQIAELSLDISADIMYSEIAPIDAIGQRGGRLHRNGLHFQTGVCRCKFCTNHKLPNNHEYCLYIFPTEGFQGELEVEKINKFAAPYEFTLLQKSYEILPNNEVYTFHKMTDWVSKVYSEIDQLWSQDFHKLFLENLIFGNKPSSIFGKEEDGRSTGKIQIRLETYEEFNVIPYDEYLNWRKEFPQKRIEEIWQERDIEVSISKGKYFKYKNDGLLESSKILRVYYSNEIGFDFSKPNQTRNEHFVFV